MIHETNTSTDVCKIRQMSVLTGQKQIFILPMPLVNKYLKATCTPYVSVRSVGNIRLYLPHLPSRDIMFLLKYSGFNHAS